MNDEERLARWERVVKAVQVVVDTDITPSYGDPDYENFVCSYCHKRANESHADDCEWWLLILAVRALEDQIEAPSAGHTEGNSAVD